MSKIYGSPLFLSGSGGANKDLPPLLDNFKASVPVEGIPVKDMPSGTKMKLGRYDSEDLVWWIGREETSNKVIIATWTDNNSKMKLFSGNLCFDYKEPDNPNIYPQNGGSNRIIYSNLQQWLNSDKAANGWYSSQYEYDEPPVYQNENGFLYEWEPEELSSILDTEWSVLVDTVWGGGSEKYTAKFSLPSSINVGDSEYANPIEGEPIDIFKNGNAIKNLGITNIHMRTPVISDYPGAGIRRYSVNILDEYNYNTAIPAQGGGKLILAYIDESTLLSPEPDSDGCYTLAELAPVTIAESDNYSVTLSADKMEEIRAEQLAGAVWVYGDHSPANVNDGTKIQLTREECIVPSLEGEDVSVNRSIPWSKTKDFYARQFTYNSKKQYQTMLEGALASVIVEGAPAQVTDLVVSGSGGTATLTWVNPVDDPVYTETVVVQKVGSAPSDITDGTEIYRGTDQTCTATGLEQSTDYYFAVYTLNSSGVYGQPIVSDVYRYDFPSEPTEYSEVQRFTRSGTFTAPESGWYRIVAAGKGGTGGNGLSNEDTGHTGGQFMYFNYSGGSGGSPGVSCKNKVKLNRGEQISFEFSLEGIVSVSSLSIQATNGGNGGQRTFGQYGGPGGKAGSASGGDENYSGKSGNRGEYSYGNSNDEAVGAPSVTTTNPYVSAYGGKGGRAKAGGGYSGTAGSAAVIIFYRGNTNTPSPSTASTLSLLPTDSTLTVDWANSGDPVQTGTMLVYNTNHVPTSVNDGVSVDIPVTQATVSTFVVDVEEQQADNKKQSYTITGLANNKPVYVALFPYDANKKYGIPKTDVEIPRVHSWYDTQKELKAEVETVKAEMADYQEYYVTTQEVLK